MGRAGRSGELFKGGILMGIAVLIFAWAGICMLAWGQSSTPHPAELCDARIGAKLIRATLPVGVGGLQKPPGCNSY
jgi:hypothetical protein